MKFQSILPLSSVTTTSICRLVSYTPMKPIGVIGVGDVPYLKWSDQRIQRYFYIAFPGVLSLLDDVMNTAALNPDVAHWSCDGCYTGFFTVQTQMLRSKFDCCSMRIGSSQFFDSPCTPFTRERSEVG